MKWQEEIYFFTNKLQGDFHVVNLSLYFMNNFNINLFDCHSKERQTMIIRAKMCRNAILKHLE